jgi:hypothetical protein
MKDEGGSPGKYMSAACPAHIFSVPKNVAVRAGAFEANLVILQRVNENPVRFDVAIPASGKLSSQWMIPVFRRQGLSGNQEIEGASEGSEVFARPVHPFDILLELRTAAETSHRPRSA